MAMAMATHDRLRQKVADLEERLEIYKELMQMRTKVYNDTINRMDTLFGELKTQKERVKKVERGIENLQPFQENERLLEAEEQAKKAAIKIEELFATVTCLSEKVRKLTENVEDLATFQTMLKRPREVTPDAPQPYYATGT